MNNLIRLLETDGIKVLILMIGFLIFFYMIFAASEQEFKMKMCQQNTDLCGPLLGN